VSLHGGRILILSNDLATPGGLVRIADMAEDALSLAGLDFDHLSFGLSAGPGWSLRHRRLSAPRRPTIALRAPIWSLLPESQVLPALAATVLLRSAASHRKWVACLVLGGAAYHGWPMIRLGVPTMTWLSTTIADERRLTLETNRTINGRLLAMCGPGLKEMERRVLSRSQTVWSMSEHTSRAIQDEYGVQAELVRPPIAASCSARRTKEPPDGSLRLLFVGRTTDPRKDFGGLVAILRVFSESRPENPIEMVVVGGAVPLPELPANLTFLFTGRLTDPELHEWYGWADLLVLSSFQEGFGLVVQEALAHGLPILTTPSGGPEAMVLESDAGWVCQLDEFPDRFAQILAHRTDHADRSRRAMLWAESQPTAHQFASRIAADLGKIQERPMALRHKWPRYGGGRSLKRRP
jgi:glycosyltransferase involved in cell wall biosynthesis